MRALGIGLIGTGFMGRAHALAFRNVSSAFELPVHLHLAALADADAERAQHCANAWGFARAHGDWQQLISDPAVDVVAITTPNHLHFPMAMAAIAAGKAVYCEKPLAVSLQQAEQMHLAARVAGVVTRVGYNYQHNPMLVLAKQMIERGDLGRIISFQGEFSHLLAMARYLVGDVQAVCADSQTVHPQRPASRNSSELRDILIDDQTHALVRFSNGARGTLSSSWLKHGYKNHLSFEISGTGGTLKFDQERLNELHLCKAGQAGFERLLAGPELPGYAAFSPAGGHQLGYNELKTLEVHGLIQACAGNPAPGPDFEEAWQVERLAAAIREAAEQQRWITL
jgi:predicted dehydrogenase